MTTARPTSTSPGQPPHRLDADMRLQLELLSREDLAAAGIAGRYESTGGDPRLVAEALANGHDGTPSRSLTDGAARPVPLRGRLGISHPHRSLGTRTAIRARTPRRSARRRSGRPRRRARAPLRTTHPPHRRPPLSLPKRPRPPGPARKHLTGPATAPAARARHGRRHPATPRLRDWPSGGLSSERRPQHDLWHGLRARGRTRVRHGPRAQQDPGRQRRGLRPARLHTRGAPRDADLSHSPVRARRTERAARTRPA